MTLDFTEDMKQMSCFIQEVDIPQFVYKLHTLFGDYHQDLIANMNMLATGTVPDYIAVMSHNHISLHDAHFAYCRFCELHQILYTSEYKDAHLFCLHIDQKQEGAAIGSVLLTDVKRLKDDIRDNGILPIGIQAVRESGRKAQIPMDRWYRMDLSEKQKLRSWGYQYSPTGLDAVKDHYAALLNEWKEAACPMQEIFVLERFNEIYMAAAQYPQEGMYRIPYPMATQAAICRDASVFRLLPDGPKELTPITAISIGLPFESNLDFAVRQEDMNTLASFIRRETGKILEACRGEPRPQRRTSELSL